MDKITEALVEFEQQQFEKKLSVREPDNNADGVKFIPPETTVHPGHLEELLGLEPFAGKKAEEESAPTPNGRWEPKYLNSRHREIMRRLLTGATYIEIAEQMGIHKQTVMLVATSQVFRTELAKLEAAQDYSVATDLQNMAREALDTIKLGMRQGQMRDRIKASTEILDRSGYVKVEKRIIGICSAEDVIKEMNRRKREAEDANGTTVVVEPDERTAVVR